MRKKIKLADRFFLTQHTCKTGSFFKIIFWVYFFYKSLFLYFPILFYFLLTFYWLFFSNSIVFHINQFIRNFKDFNSNPGCGLSKQEMSSYLYHFWAEICLFFDNVKLFSRKSKYLYANHGYALSNQEIQNLNETKIRDYDFHIEVFPHWCKYLYDICHVFFCVVIVGGGGCEKIVIVTNNHLLSQLPKISLCYRTIAWILN